MATQFNDGTDTNVDFDSVRSLQSPPITTAVENIGQAVLDRVKKSGSTMTGGHLTLFQAPTSANHAATKAYVDSVATGSLADWKASCGAATTAALPTCTYNNGAGTLTGNSNGALTAQDGVTPTASMRILVKNQASNVQNGIYVVTTVGDGGNPFVLTRATDADAAAEITKGAATLVDAGSTLAGTTWFVNVTVTTLGTDPITWVQTTAAAALADDSVTFAKMQNLATDRLIGRDTAGTGDPEAISLAATLAFTGSGSIGVAATSLDATHMTSAFLDTSTDLDGASASNTKIASQLAVRSFVRSSLTERGLASYYGLVGDGTTNNTAAAVLAALDDAVAAKVTVLVDGTFVVDGTVTWTGGAGKRLHIRGRGWSTDGNAAAGISTLYGDGFIANASTFSTDGRPVFRVPFGAWGSLVHDFYVHCNNRARLGVHCAGGESIMENLLAFKPKLDGATDSDAVTTNVRAAGFWISNWNDVTGNGSDASQWGYKHMKIIECRFDGANLGGVPASATNKDVVGLLIANHSAGGTYGTVTDITVDRFYAGSYKNNLNGTPVGSMNQGTAEGVRTGGALGGGGGTRLRTIHCSTAANAHAGIRINGGNNQSITDAYMDSMGSGPFIVVDANQVAVSDVNVIFQNGSTAYTYGLIHVDSSSADFGLTGPVRLNDNGGTRTAPYVVQFSSTSPTRAVIGGIVVPSARITTGITNATSGLTEYGTRRT